MASRNTILLSNDEYAGYAEAPAAEAIYPGQFGRLNPDGEMEVMDSPTLLGPPIIILEDALQGKTIDDAYAEGDIVRYHRLKVGQRFMFRMGTSTVITKGAMLALSSGNAKAAVTDEEPIAQASEAVTTTTAASHVQATYAGSGGVFTTTTTTTTTT